MPRALHGDEWPMGVWGQRPKVKLAFSVSSFLLVEEAEEAEEAPTFGRGSSLYKGLDRVSLTKWAFGECAGLALEAERPVCHFGQIMPCNFNPR